MGLKKLPAAVLRSEDTGLEQEELMEAMCNRRHPKTDCLNSLGNKSTNIPLCPTLGKDLGIFCWPERLLD